MVLKNNYEICKMKKKNTKTKNKQTLKLKGIGKAKKRYKEQKYFILITKNILF